MKIVGGTAKSRSQFMGYTPYVLRPSFATNALEKFENLRTIQVMFGYENIEAKMRPAINSGKQLKNPQFFGSTVKYIYFRRRNKKKQL